MYYDNPVKMIDDIIDYIDRDSYNLTRDQQSAIEWRLREVQTYIKDTYAKSGKQFSK